MLCTLYVTIVITRSKDYDATTVDSSAEFYTVNIDAENEVYVLHKTQFHNHAIEQ